jgi:hypothetical protein
MKPWQSIVVNFIVTVLAVFAGVRVFPQDIQHADVKEVRDVLDMRMKNIQESLTAIQDAISKQQRIMPNVPQGAIMGMEKLAELDQKLDMVLRNLSVFEKKISDIQVAAMPQAAVRPPMISSTPLTRSPIGRGDPMGWFEELSVEKRRQVDLIFEEHARRIRERLPSEPDGRLPDRETMRKLRKESDLELKEELKAVLTEEEYQRFIDSHPKPQSRNQPLSGGEPRQLQ